MQIHVTLPSQISIPVNKALVCKGIYGTDATNFTCSGNSTTRKIILEHGFDKSSKAPPNITFTIADLRNPVVANLTTDSFILETYSFFGNTKLDSISTYLTVSFNCTDPCKTCSESVTNCTSC